MKENPPPKFENEFAEEVYYGLTAKEKYLSSRFFYDKEGDLLFQKIMQLPEYYLTRSEYEILDTYKKSITNIFSAQEGFDLLELGAGDGTKTKLLLQELLRQEQEFTYHPVDISENALNKLTKDLQQEFPQLKIQPKPGSYLKVLEQLSSFSDRKKVILFLGSNIGNFDPSAAKEFLIKIMEIMGAEDLLFIGMDSQKEPSRILKAYNDKTGVTAAFNKNVLKRINNELGGNFDLDSFQHWPIYDPTKAEAKSYLISKKEQEISIKGLNLRVHFRTWESIHTERSRKFNEPMVEEMAEAAGLKIFSKFSDEKEFFRNYIFKKK